MYKVKKAIRIKNNINTTLERHPVPVLGIDYKVKIVYKNVKVPELNVENKLIKISLPNRYKKDNNQEILDPEDYEIKNMKKEIGRCVEGKITINPKIVMFHRDVIDFIVLHEYCHLKYKTHSKYFYRMIENYEPNFEKYEKILEISLFQY